ncbi:MULTISPECIES: HAD family hydrolase [Streptomyces]|nr:HAD family hydrolase [Streptomyces venezuelae]APE23138.1 haloacid dehalogenase [Streptomyces venezuelae]QES00518.1 HAD family hydrolase [Streptomyces venezuelae ATCC 10712]QES07604.1 HAD family hydrolase [Streptomyces venezuelae]
MTTSATRPPLTVGFDLDLTLIDTRPGIRAAWVAFSAESGVPVDADLVVSRLGPPLEHEMAYWVPEERVTEMVARYRALYPAYAIEPSAPMPGARDAIRAVREAGGRTIVVTAKNGPHAELHLAHLGIEPDAVVGGLWAEGKAEALRAHGAQVYVGDHVGDVRGAATAGALSVAVATGPCAPEELKEAGADVVLPDLTDFRSWWEGYLA